MYICSSINQIIIVMRVLDISVTLSYNREHHLIPNVYFSIGSHCYLVIYFLCFKLRFNFSTYNNKVIYNFSSPCISIIECSPNEPYDYVFEISFFKYVFKRGIGKKRDKGCEPYNTPGFVHISWYNQFKTRSNVDKVLEYFNKSNEELNKLIDDLNKESDD